MRIACALGLVALAMMCVSILFPRPLPVILAMSLGHVIGGAAFALLPAGSGSRRDVARAPRQQRFWTPPVRHARQQAAFLKPKGNYFI